MSVLRNVLETMPRTSIVFETYDRAGERVMQVDGAEFVEYIQAFRKRFAGWDDDGRKVVALLFRPEETIEFLVTAFAAMSEGFTVVPLYPNWSAETQLQYLGAYRLRAIAAGNGFAARAEGWLGSAIDRVIPVALKREELIWSRWRPSFSGGALLELPRHHPCAWIFTSGTSGKLAKLTEITLENIEAAVENILDLDFLYPGMTVHSPLSSSHIFAFVAILGFLAVKPRRVLFSDVQYLSRLPRAKTGKVDGIILVPIVLNRMRATFYEKLAARLDPKTVPREMKSLARIPIGARRLLKRVILRAEQAVIDLETTGRTNPAGWAAIRLGRKLFGRIFQEKLGSPEFVVVGGAKPSLQSMAFLEVMGIRCLQGWGMTETTGPLSVCRLGDRGAFGTCGTIFDKTRAYIEDGELIVEGPQVARGYHEPDGAFIPFNGVKRTGDHAEFDPEGRLRVLGKASDRITTDNGINYNPVPFEEELHALDLKARHILEEAVVIGDGQPRLGAVFFVRDGVPNDGETRGYLHELVRAFNAAHAVDEQLSCWAQSEKTFREAGVLGPSGKLVRLRVEENFAGIFLTPVEIGG